MKKIILSLVMGLGLVSFAQAEEECITTSSSMMTAKDGDCNKKSDQHFYAFTAICRNRIGGAVKMKNRICEAGYGHDGPVTYESCVKKKVKISDDTVKGCHGGGMDPETVESIKFSWKKKICFTGTQGDCRGGGNQTKKGCEIGDTTATQFFYDSKCTISNEKPMVAILPRPAAEGKIVGVPGGFGVVMDPKTSDTKEKKIDTTPVQLPKHGGFGAPAEAGSAK